MFNQTVCIPKDIKLRRMVQEAAHKNMFTIYLGSANMYQDLKKDYWLPNMKRSITEYVPEYMVCQQVKIEHQKPNGLLQPLDVPVWKCDSISMDFVVGLPCNQDGYGSIG